MKRQRPSTRFSKDGLTVYVQLRVDRQKYEYARHWASAHADGFPDGTAEDGLEGYLNTALMTAMEDDDWVAPPEIRALYPPPPPAPKSDMEDDIPF